MISVFRVHPEKVRAEQGSFFAAGACAYFQDDVLIVVGVFGQQRDLQLFRQLFGLFLQLGQFFLGHLAHLVVGAEFVQHFLGGRQLFLHLFIFLIFLDDGLHLAQFLDLRLPEGLVGDDVRIGHRHAQLFVLFQDKI